jgi:L-asparaginase
MMIKDRKSRPSIRYIGLSLTLAAAAFLISSPSCLAQTLPKVRLFSTGGTIQGYGANRDQIANYRAGQIPPDKLLEDLPEAKTVADVSYEAISATRPSN